MHAGRITGDTIEAALYRRLMLTPGFFVDAKSLQNLAHDTPCLSTYLSGVRGQLPAGWDLECESRSVAGQRRKRHYYRIVPAPGVQAELEAV